MTCDELRPELTGFHFGALEPDARRALEAHLLGCRACLEEFLELKRAIEVADDEPGPSPASRARLRRAVADELRGARPAHAWSWWERPLAVGFAMASVVLALGAVQAVASGNGALPHGMSAGEVDRAPRSGVSYGP